MRKNRVIPIKNKPKFAFVVDGECEFWYIQMLKRNERQISVDLKPEIPQRKKLLDQYTKVIDLSKDYDKVFWIIDFDVIISETRKAKKGAETALQEFKRYYIDIEKRFENIFIIVNNPCLEFWILLHYKTTSKYFDNCDSVTKELKKHLTNYEKTQSYYTKQDNDIYLKLKPNLINAISNASKLKELDFENPNTAISEMQIFYEIEEIKRITEQK
ncbi:RloB family protein [Flavobacterium branchiophilum]|uniref:RloB-like protein n=1 Tax=Flavobacterium branchiophilum TaxID=55197 RepID=A0A2H3K8X7_9FLAO|nr:RloB family protein [Flavobacterium branchiophilum]PDS22299.1 RloB-like protein [Flavobacterium branchiophilum]